MKGAVISRKWPFVTKDMVWPMAGRVTDNMELPKYLADPR